MEKVHGVSVMTKLEMFIDTSLSSFIDNPKSKVFRFRGRRCFWYLNKSFASSEKMVSIDFSKYKVLFDFALYW